jgi:hypothetical protein
MSGIHLGLSIAVIVLSLGFPIVPTVVRDVGFRGIAVSESGDSDLFDEPHWTFTGDYYPVARADDALDNSFLSSGNYSSVGTPTDISTTTANTTNYYILIKDPTYFLPSANEGKHDHGAPVKKAMTLASVSPAPKHPRALTPSASPRSTHHTSDDCVRCFRIGGRTKPFFALFFQELFRKGEPVRRQRVAIATGRQRQAGLLLASTTPLAWWNHKL